MFSKLSDTELIALLTPKNVQSSSAYAELCSRYQNKLAAYLRLNNSIDGDTINDILQDTFLTAWNKITQLDDHAKLFSWLLTIARNRLMDFFREQKKFNDYTQWFEQQHSDDLQYEMRHDQSDLEKLLVHLPSQDREIVLLKAVLELSFDEICEVSTLSLSAVKMRYYRALDTLSNLSE
ncbi:RNA polymerase sigma factor [Bermanella sp. WJH001]|uniref:RNA polymerase sigma factor n=1 Tax=Bermanella sp. WJH001 TaxID=3048005 RepID=UPI0024BDD209|nr:RNA polymerase sigma factor [Bermanella sp. WJH001]MDJ1539109.1 RNA polymerase sigma factor [Bermanella sp. WJH001]